MATVCSIFWRNPTSNSALGERAPHSELVKEGRTSWVSTVHHWSSLVSQGHRVVSSLTARPCWLQWLGSVTLLLLPCCKATTGLGRLPCQQYYISCCPTLWQFFWSHSTGVEERDWSTGESRNYLMTVMGLAEVHYCNAEKEQTHWLEKAIKTGR